MIYGQFEYIGHNHNELKLIKLLLFAPRKIFRFFRQFLVFFALHQMALSLFRFLAAIGRIQVVANTIATFTLLIVFVLGGFIVAKGPL